MLDVGRFTSIFYYWSLSMVLGWIGLWQGWSLLSIEATVLPNPPPCTPMGKGIGMILSAPILTLALYVFKGLCSRSVTLEGPLVADWFVLISVWMWIHLEVFMSFSRWTSFPCHKLAIKQLPTWENLWLWISAPSGGPMVYSHNLPLFIRALGGNVSL